MFIAGVIGGLLRPCAKSGMVVVVTRMAAAQMVRFTPNHQGSTEFLVACLVAGVQSTCFTG